MKRQLMLSLMVCCTLAISALTQAAEPAYVTPRIITAPIAVKIAGMAEAHCRKQGYQVSVAVVDRYGNLLAFARHPLAGAHTIGVSQDKAYTAASFQGATGELAERLAFLKGTPRVSLVGGGVPIRLGGFMYGAVGVSGAPRQKTPGDVDHACAIAGIEAVQEDIEFGLE
jgi:uncharacterized protein GlcG (DUF336 family)